MMKEPALFPPTPQRLRKALEDEEFYAAVLKLRRAGNAVFRGGGDMHTVNGVRVTRPQLLALAKYT